MKIVKIETVDIDCRKEFCYKCDFMRLGYCRLFFKYLSEQDDKYLRLDECISGENHIKFISKVFTIDDLQAIKNELCELTDKINTLKRLL